MIVKVLADLWSAVRAIVRQPTFVDVGGDGLHQISFSIVLRRRLSEHLVLLDESVQYSDCLIGLAAFLSVHLSRRRGAALRPDGLVGALSYLLRPRPSPRPLGWGAQSLPPRLLW